MLLCPDLFCMCGLSLLYAWHHSQLFHILYKHDYLLPPMGSALRYIRLRKHGWTIPSAALRDAPNSSGGKLLSKNDKHIWGTFPSLKYSVLWILHTLPNYISESVSILYTLFFNFEKKLPWTVETHFHPQWSVFCPDPAQSNFSPVFIQIWLFLIGSGLYQVW